MLRSTFVTVCTLGLLTAVASLPAFGQQSAPAGKLRVVVSIAPHANFVERIGGERVQVDTLVAPGQSPHAYEPTPRQVTALAEARVYFRVGVPFEDGLVPKIRASFPKLEIVDTRDGIKLRTLEAECGHEEHGAKDQDHAAAGTRDPHVWLAPQLAKIQTATMCAALARLDPPNAEFYRKNLAAFHADLDRVDAQLAAALAPLKGREFFVFHPAFGYFADAYGLKQVPVEIDGKEPSARQIAALIDRARQAGVKVIFVQPQFPTRAAEAVAEAIGGVVVPLDDLPRDYLKNLEDMAAKVQAALSGKTK